MKIFIMLIFISGGTSIHNVINKDNNNDVVQENKEYATAMDKADIALKESNIVEFKKIFLENQNAYGSFGESFAHWAVYRGSIEALVFLIDGSYNINKKDMYGNTPLPDGRWTLCLRNTESAGHTELFR